MLNFDRTNYFDSNNPNDYLRRSKKEKQDNLEYLKTLEFKKGKQFYISKCKKSQYTIYISYDKEFCKPLKVYVYKIEFYPFVDGQIKYSYGLKDEEYKDLIESIKIKED